MDYKKIATKKIQEVLKDFETSKSGLSSNQVDHLLQKYGKNQFITQELGWWQILLRQFKSPFVYLLFGACLLSFLLGETLDGLMILLFVTINATLGFYQEYHSEKTIKLLKKYITPKIEVIREGKEEKIETTLLVPGDIVSLEPGDIIPADVRFIKTGNLTLDESILTGESVPAEKSAEEQTYEPKEIYETQNIGFSGTTIVSGSASAIIIATGKNTIYGKIAYLTTQVKKESIFEKEIARFSKFTLGLVGITLILVVLASIAIKESPSLVELTIFSVALAVGAIPEALPVVMTFSLSLGALNLAKNQVIVKRLSAVEDLGSIEVLCCDKTGTLTENHLTVDEIYSHDKTKTLIYGLLASSHSLKKIRKKDDAFESAMLNKLTLDEQKLIEGFKHLLAFPFDPLRRRSSSIIEKDSLYQLTVRGMPDNIIERSTDLSPSQKEHVLAWIVQKGKEGRRVLAVASKNLDSAHITDADVSKIENNLSLLGVISFIDPIKTTTYEAITQAKKLGIKIKILTGDSKEVAGSVAYQIKLINSPEEVTTGQEFENRAIEDQQEAIEKYHVFARVSPQQKYKIIELLQKKYEVGFLGEGINDAPALKLANVALVVSNASDIARETSDIVLLKKSLNVIIEGIKQGRNVFVNTTKYITATLSANFGNFFAVALASLIIDYLPMLPLQILLVNLLSDFPMIALATDSVDEESTKYPKRYQLKNFALIALILGSVSTIFDFLFFGVFFRTSPSTLQTSWFMGSILTELLFVFSIRTKLFFLKGKKPSLALLSLFTAAFFLTLIIPYTAIGYQIFKFSSPTSSQLLIIITISTLYLITTEAVKLLYYKFAPEENKHPSSP